MIPGKTGAGSKVRSLRWFRFRGQSILLFLDSQLFLELHRADVVLRRMTMLRVVVTNVLRDLPQRLGIAAALHQFQLRLRRPEA